MTVEVRPACESDFDFAVDLLAAAGLPTEDFNAAHLVFVAEADSLPLGIIGSESFGDVTLLRSLVTAPSARGRGVGSLLVRALECASGSDGVAEIWLLTIDADPFFERHGYRVRERDDAPDAIQQTREFSGLCPASAVLMSKSL